MKVMTIRIKGIPYSKNKARGKIQATEEWTQDVTRQTEGLPKIKEACMMKVTFLLPADKFPKNFPFGPDLDNLLKRLCDALNKTIFSESPEKDSCIISLNAVKSKVNCNKDCGVNLEILPINVK
ncbi:MAG: RusA family crossover junction endodeoxyribonuclease [Candidatus Zapsychrus exili]|nr:RusA family crossover junction endodeoxyribonuclease [Candidatus Zapsychrus exili]